MHMHMHMHVHMHMHMHMLMHMHVHVHMHMHMHVHMHMHMHMTGELDGAAWVRRGDVGVQGCGIRAPPIQDACAHRDDEWWDGLDSDLGARWLHLGRDRHLARGEIVPECARELGEAGVGLRLQ